MVERVPFGRIVKEFKDRCWLLLLLLLLLSLSPSSKVARW